MSSGNREKTHLGMTKRSLRPPNFQKRCFCLAEWWLNSTHRITENKTMSIWQFYRHWWHRKLSLRQPIVPAATTNCQIDDLLFSMMGRLFLATFLNSSPPSAAYIRQWIGSALVQVMACRLFGAKPLPEPMLTCCQLDSWEQISVKFELEFYQFHSRKCIKFEIIVCQNGGHFFQGEMS